MANMTQIINPHPIREDEHLVDFGDTREFAAVKWTTAEKAQDIKASDRMKASSIPSYEEFGNWIRQNIQDSQSAQQQSYLQTVLLLARPLWGFISCFENLVHPHQVDMSILWGLVFLNVNAALSSNEKLKRVTTWLKSLRQSLEALNQCVENCDDENAARTQITDVFEPLLQFLTSLVKFQRTYVADATFAKSYGVIKEAVDQYIVEIDEVVYHFRQISMHSKSKSQDQADLFHKKGIPFREPKNAYDHAAFPVDNLPNIRTDQFFGREATLDRIEKHLGDHVDEKLRTYLIYGRRGVGKTQIALEYARRYQSKFDAVFWIQCETSASLRQSFTDIAVSLALPGVDKTGHFEENQIKVLQWLKKTRMTWLLIYDNAERDQSLEAYWPRETVGSILLTSRSYYNFEHKERRDGETIPVFTEDERWELLMKLVGEKWQNEHLGGQQGLLERAAAAALMEKLGGLALAISQAAQLILDTKSTGDQSIVTLLRLFEDARLKLPLRLSSHRDALTHALDTIWSIALNGLSPNARSLLGVFSLLAPDSILIDLFLPTNQARLNGRLAFCKQEDQGKAAVEISKKMQTAVDELKAAGLIRQDKRNFIIHRVIQEAMNYTDMNDLQESFDAATQILHEAFPLRLKGRPLYPVWHQCQLFVQHVVHLSNAFTIYRRGKHGPIVPDLDFVRVLSNCGWYLYEVADYGESLKMIEVACSAADDKSTLLYSDLLNTIGAIRFEKNQLKKSRIAFQESRMIREELLESDDLQVAMVLANIGNIESAEHNLDEAEHLFETAARIREKHGDSQLVMLGLTFLQLGRVCFLRGDTASAINRYDKAESCFVKKGDQVFLAHLHYARGNLEFGRRDLNQAMSQYERCREACHSIGPVHPLAAAMYYKLGCIEVARGRKHSDRALNYFSKAFDIADTRSPGEIDGTIARIMFKKSEVLMEDPIRRQEGWDLRKQMLVALTDVASDLGLTLDPDMTEEERFDMLLPGYFR